MVAIAAVVATKRLDLLPMRLTAVMGRNIGDSYRNVAKDAAPPVRGGRNVVAQREEPGHLLLKEVVAFLLVAAGEDVLLPLDGARATTHDAIRCLDHGVVVKHRALWITNRFTTGLGVAM